MRPRSEAQLRADDSALLGGILAAILFTAVQYYGGSIMELHLAG